MDLASGELVGRVVQAGNSIGGAISQDGKLVAVSNYKPGGAKVFDADTLELERALSERLGLAVAIEPAKGNAERGRVTIAYQDLEQLDEIMRVLNAGAA